MIHALTELVAEHLADTVHGVNAMLDAVPVWSTGEGSLLVEDEPPAVQAIYSEFQHDWIAQDKDPPAVPSLTVFAATDADLGVFTGDRETRVQKGDAVTIAVLYMARHKVGARARREASYTLRAVRGSLLRLVDRLPQASRTVRGVTLVSFDRLTEQRLARDVGQGSLAGLVLARASVVDALRL